MLTVNSGTAEDMHCGLPCLFWRELSLDVDHMGIMGSYRANLGKSRAKDPTALSTGVK